MNAELEADDCNFRHRREVASRQMIFLGFWAQSIRPVLANV